MRSAHANKKDDERIILKFFSQAYDGFPKGKIIDSESPDFIVKISPKNAVGIEITRLTAMNGNNGEKESLKIDSHERLVCDFAKNIFEKKSGLKLNVDIFFRSGVKITDDEQYTLAEKIARIIENTVKAAGKKKIFQKEIESRELNKIIDYIQVTYFPALEQSRWENAGRYFVPELTKELLTNTIQLKEEKLPLYKKKRIGALWLILYTNGFSRSVSFNIRNQVEAWDIPSSFDRVFMLELMKFRAIEVK